jgi:hypothetical protein
MMVHDDGGLRMSPSGKRVAYVRYENGRDRLLVRDTAAGSPAVLVTGAPGFSKNVSVVRSIEWVGHDDLVFWAGARSKAGAAGPGMELEMYRFRVSTGGLSNLTRTGSTTKPFDGGKVYPVGGWRGPDGRHLYFLQTNGTHANLGALDTSSFSVEEITRGAFVVNSRIVAVARGDRVFYPARESSSNSHPDNLFMFDRRVASTPVKLYGGKKGSIRIDVVNQEGSLVIFSVADATLMADLRGVKAGLIDLRGQVITSRDLFAPDNLSLTYTWVSFDEWELRIRPLNASGYRWLDGRASFIGPLLVY